MELNSSPGAAKLFYSRLFSSNPRQRKTGNLGYLGKRGSVADRPH
jgi:hypothetical protein